MNFGDLRAFVTRQYNLYRPGHTPVVDIHGNPLAFIYDDAKKAIVVIKVD